MLVQISLCPGEHAVVHSGELLGNCLLQIFQLDHDLFPVGTANDDALALFQITGTAFHTKGHTLHLILGALPAHRVVGVVQLGTETGLDQAVLQRICCIQNAGLVLGNGQDHHLGGSDLGRQHQAVVVAVGHDDAADETGGHTPGGLVGIGLLVVLVGELNLKCLGEAVTEVVGGTGLQSLAVMHHALDGVGGLGTVELFLVGLAALGNGHGQHVLAEVSIDVQHGLGESLGFLSGGMQGMALLPQELPVAQEGTGGLLPAKNAAPLVILHGQIPVGLQHMGEMLAEQSLGSGADGILLLQTLHTAVGDPGALGSEALDVVLLLLQQAFGDQQRHVDILHTLLLEFLIHDILDILPDGIAIRTVNEHALDGRIVDQLGLLAHVGEPLCKVDLHIGDLFNLFIFCHSIFILSGFPFFVMYIVAHLSSQGKGEVKN